MLVCVFSVGSIVDPILSHIRDRLLTRVKSSRFVPRIGLNFGNGNVGKKMGKMLLRFSIYQSLVFLNPAGIFIIYIYIFVLDCS